MLYILIVNYDSATRLAIRKAAEAKGHIVISEATSAGEARENMLRDGWPSVLITDIMLPDLSGLELAEAIFKRQLPMSVIVTGKSSWHQHIRQAMRSGALDYLVEPFSDCELSAALDQASKRVDQHYEQHRYIYLIKSFFDELENKESDMLMKEQSDLLTCIFHMQEKRRGERKGLLYLLATKWKQELDSRRISFKLVENIESKFEAAAYFRKAAELWIEQVKPLPGQEKSLFIKQSQRYVQERYAEELTLESMVRRLDVSVSYFSKLFKQETGMTFIQYVNYVRIAQAKEVLLCSNQLISATAYSCGFTTVQHFNRAFKKETGMTPNEYRQWLGSLSLQ